MSDGEEIDTDRYDNIFDKMAGEYFKPFVSSSFDDQDLDEFKNKLQQAQISTSSEQYISKSILYGSLAGFNVFALWSFIYFCGFIIGLWLNIFGSIILSVIFYFLTSIILFSIFGGLVGFIHYSQPKYKAGIRRARIDNNLTGAVTLLYALNKGGMGVEESLKKLAQNEHAYGEISREVTPIVREVEFFSTELLEALRNAEERTPSARFSDFLDGLIATIDAGADMNSYLYSRIDAMQEDDEIQEQKVLDKIEALGQVYFVVVVAGIMLLTIITVVMALLGGLFPFQLEGIIYILIPIINIGFYFLIDFIMGVDSKIEETIPESLYLGNNEEEYDIEKVVKRNDDEKLNKVYKEKKKRERTRLLRDPIKELTINPDKTAYATIPITILYYILGAAFGLYSLSFSSFVDDPVTQTFFSMIVPMLIISVPIIIFFERKARRRSKVIGRLPAAVEQIASSNEVGLTISESFEQSSQTTSGRFGDELKKTKSDIDWNGNIKKPLIQLANRLRVPMFSQVVTLITEASASTGNLTQTLNTASNNIQNKVNLRKRRIASVTKYTGIIIFSFFIFLVVIAAIDVSFLSSIEDQQEEQGDGGTDGGDDEFVTDIPVPVFRLRFYHATVLQALGAGMIAGYLRTEDPRSGLKFSVVLILISTLVFYLL